MPIAPRTSLLAGVLTAGLMATPAVALPAAAAATGPTPVTTEATAAEASTAEDTETISLMSFNDFHGALSENYAGTLFAHTVEDYRTEFEAANGEGSTLLTTAGDLIGASASVSNVQQDEPTIEIMNALGLAASAAGNHEFDKSLKDLQGRVLDLADYPVLAANFVSPDTKEPVLQSHEIFSVDGVRVAVIGAVPNNLYATTTGAGLEGNEVIDLVEGVNAVATELEANDEADVIVASYHDGASGNGDLAAETADSEVFNSIVNETDESVDVIFNGHSHQTYNYDTTIGGKERPVVQAGQSGNLLAAVELTLDSETKEVVAYTSELIERTATPVTAEEEFDQEGMDALVAGSTATVQEVYGIEKAAVAEFDGLKNTVIGEIDASITTDYATRIAENGAWRAGGTRREESTLGNWAADALKDRVSLTNPDVDLGVTNSGGLRAELLVDKLTAGGEFTDKPDSMVGKVSLGEILDFAPFGNTLAYFDIPGSSIKQVLEENWQNGKKALHLGWSKELTWTYDDTRAQDDKVTGIWINGVPVEMDEMYTIATLSFLGDTSWVGTENPAPDGYEGFAQGQENYVDLGIMDNQAFQEYVQAQTTATGDIRPDYSKNSVEVQGAPTTVKAEDEIGLTLDNLELESDGAGDATSVSVAFETGGGNRTQLGAVEVPAEGETVTLSGIKAPKHIGGKGDLFMTVTYDDKYESTSVVRTPLTVTDAVDFTDNQSGSQFHEPIRWMQENGVSGGYTDGSYRKFREISREESLAFIFRHLDPGFTAGSDAPFPDVPVGHNQFDPIAWAKANEVSLGYEDKTFKASLDVTRGEFASFLYRAVGAGDTGAQKDDAGKAGPIEVSYSDVVEDSAHYGAIVWASSQGIVKGYQDGDFRPGDPINRGEVAQMMQRYDDTVSAE